MAVNSLWAATAQAAPPLAPLAGERQCDVAIIGAGYTGLSAAWHIAQSGREPLLLEANELGFGASGRNGGVVSPKFRVGFSAAMARHGREAALHLYHTGHAAVDGLAQLIDELGLDQAALHLGGHIAAAHTPRALAGLQATADWVKRETGSASVRLIDAEQVRELTGATLFHGGLLTPHAGGLHPLNFTRGLAWRLHQRGVGIYVGSPALAVREEGGRFSVQTPGGHVSARQVIYATNGYSDQTPVTASLHRRLIPFRSAIIATEPLAPALLASLMPGGQVCGDTKRMLRWFRVVGDRLIFGGRGAFGQQDSAQAFDTLQRSMVQVFPQLASVAIGFRWSGLVAMTLDYLPHAGELAPNQYYAVGYNGGGVAMSTWMGAQLAAMSAGEPVQLGLLAGKGFNPIPLHGLRAPGVRLAAGWQQLLDAVGR
ncbi:MULTISPECIES: FAD-binding oxidoreductase [unclassified Pseudomonas]|uniref:NAD(P)/FAD-dependent oxidoreductase n=1 Tax=unclassified Pseudomonas TaxID=196821 RepID=UPI000BC805D4|nr:MULTISPECIES: FAD-binding oxidoreductase [unclassified Pseudomonas]PVZ19695.1 glycine/D-amino acid oxidase-like deaminating enzyme [Pseudomonas sp. URIL14HWK12:I12]PVZ22720.1 glycine/D-amino acid oxidase-like deaminating enzyme [Pseudomonas sp. URIL14HWK12:I10]PVZ37650.1 glycine/D-amino acid oxidase-like deaminating enzyme [Pseudomonas sp. URIL14HWK12:I11]SNZ15383.1 Glycine/D-amino acid oxidase [Pseudomonas sp. URIL14HWK12:I9]